MSVFVVSIGKLLEDRNKILYFKIDVVTVFHPFVRDKDTKFLLFKSFQIFYCKFYVVRGSRKTARHYALVTINAATHTTAISYQHPVTRLVINTQQSNAIITQ